MAGDGIGPEILAVAVKVLEAVADAEGLIFEFEEALIGGAAIDKVGTPLPVESLDAAERSDAVLLAAIGGYKWDHLPSKERPEGGLLAIRAALGCFANLRPASILPQLASASSLKPELVAGVDIMVVRELTGGIYFGEPRGFGLGADGTRTGYNTDIYSEAEVDRIARIAFDVARKRKGRVVSVDKANVLEVSQLWREKVSRLGKEVAPDIELSHMYVDNCAMQLVRAPTQFDTILTGNIFGDILSDCAAMLTGSIGMLPSASVGEPGKPGIFEPVHGSAPDIAGTDKANPLAQVLSAAMMLRYAFGEEAAAARIERAVAAFLDAGYRTCDLILPSAKADFIEVGCTRTGELLVEMIRAA